MTDDSIAVIGAGVVGCLAAREILERAPSAPVTLLDRDLAAGGASLRSAGLHLPAGATPRVRQMAAYSERWWAAYAAAHPGAPIFPLAGTAIGGPEGAGRFTAGSARPLAAGGAAGAAIDVGGVRVDPGASGSRRWRLDGCHHADVHPLVSAIAAGLRGRAGVREGVRVVALEPAGEGIFLHLGTGETLRVDRAVLAPGPWVHDAAWRALLAPLGIRVKRIVALHIERPVREGDEVVVLPDADAFLLPLRHRGHWLFSYTCQEWDVDPDAPPGGLSAANVEEARECLRRYSPALSELCRSGRAFCDAYSPTREPLVRTVDEAGRLVFAGAANGSGYRLAPAIASLAADLVLPGAAAAAARSHRFPAAGAAPAAPRRARSVR